MNPTLLLAAHGTASAAGLATTRALAAGIAAARPELRVELCFLDVASPSLVEALDALTGPVTVVPLLLSAGYHVLTDIPAIVVGRPDVVVSRHLGPDPLIISALQDRLRAARGSIQPQSTGMVAVSSSQALARAEVEAARSALESLLGRPVALVPLGSASSSVLETLPTPIELAVYLLADGRFLDDLRSTAGAAVVAEPIGAHPAVIELALSRYAEVNQARTDTV